ncbi:synaptic vesicle 2-related protein-like isoform X1 [Apostichopus japonicus]|uniref:synaptic vesicle 2-related protein-like isoform X1 n=2 Tax=Stichopus japonicus TaxID=307972 RepID=UPI003AB81DAC
MEEKMQHPNFLDSHIGGECEVTGTIPMVKFVSKDETAEPRPNERDKLEEVDLGLGGREVKKQPYVLHEDAARDVCEDEFSVEQAVEAIGFGQFQVMLSLLTGFCWMADAMEMMILSIIGPELKCKWNLTLIQEASITTVVFLGMFVSSTFWGQLCDKFGRRVGLILTSLVVFYFGVLSGFAPSYAWLLIIRFLVGFGIGGAPQSVTLYAEYLPSKVRGICVIFIEIFWALGAVFEVTLALVIMPTLGWKYLLVLSSLPVLLFVTLCRWLPESARYYIASGQQKQAHDALKRVAVCNNKPMPLGILKAEPVSSSRGSYKELFKTRELSIVTILLLFIWFANAFSYYGVVLLSTELFAVGNTCIENTVDKLEPSCHEDCKTLSSADYVSLLWTTLAEFPGLFITIFIIEILGRKKTMAIEFFFFSCFTFLLILCTSRNVMTFFLFAARGLISGAFQAAYVYTPEVYPTASRALGLGCCSAMARVGAVITPFIAQVLIAHSPHVALGIYAVTGLLAAVACMLLPIETKGRAMLSSVQ